MIERKEELLQAIKTHKVIVILRNIETKDVEKTLKILLQNDIKIVEITMTSPNVLKSIEIAKKCFGDQLFIGAGTVLSSIEALDAIKAGAEFIISPNTDKKVIMTTLKKRRFKYSRSFNANRNSSSKRLGD